MLKEIELKRNTSSILMNLDVIRKCCGSC